MLHCLVFKEQLVVFRSSRFKRLYYLIAFLSGCQELFYFFFQPDASSPTGFRPRSSVRLPYLAATCIMIHAFVRFVNTILKNCGFFISNHKNEKAPLTRCFLPYGRGSWTRTNACGIQRPVPYQLGDTPVSSASRRQHVIL